MSGAAVDPRVRDNAIDWLVRMQSGLMSAADHQPCSSGGKPASSMNTRGSGSAACR